VDLMPNPRVAVLTDHSLLAEGVISRLRGYPETFDLQVFDNNAPNVMARMEHFHPLVVILEESASCKYETCFLKQIFSVLPSLIIIYLRHGQSKVQIIQSEQYPANEVRELLDIIQTSNEQNHIDNHNSTKRLTIERLVEIYAGEKR
jgi:hypothetical protein